MIHARDDYNAVQDTTDAKVLAAHVLQYFQGADDKDRKIQQLIWEAREVLGQKHQDPVPTAYDVQKIQEGRTSIAADEPVFLLRARDMFADEAVRFWARRVHEERGDPEIIKLARGQAEKMHHWPGRKSPDTKVKFG